MIKRGLQLLKEHKDFRLLMGTQFLAQAGDGLVQTALATTIVFGGQKGFDPESARSPDEVLRIVLYTLVPYTVLSPFLGVLIDRWDRRKLMFLANALRAAVVALIALWGTGNAGDIALFSSFLLTLMSTRLVLAIKSAAIPATVDDDDLVPANGLSQLGGALFQLGGVAVALVGKDAVGAGPVLLAGAFVYGGGALLALLLKHIDDAPDDQGFGAALAGVAASIARGIREVARTPKAGASITTYLWLRLLWSFTLVSISFIARDLLDNDLEIAALTGGAGAFGAVLGFVSARRLLDRARSPARLVLASASVGGLAVAVLGGFGSVASLPLLTFGLGFGFFLGKISLDTMVQQALGDDFRGRAFSLYDIAYNLAWVIAAAALKLMWSEDTQGLLVAGMGVVFLVGMGGLALWYRSAGLLTGEPGPPSRNVT